MVDIEPGYPYSRPVHPARLSKGPDIELNSSHTGSGNLDVPSLDRSECDRRRWHEHPRIQNLKSKIPEPISSRTRKAVEWFQGPQPPKQNRITPFFERFQTFHTRQFARLPRFARACMFICAFMLWLVVFGVVLSKDGLPSDIGGFGAPVRLGCTNRLWSSAQSCGTDGVNCLPFSDSSFAFTCPADCAGVQLLNPYAIGDISINYRPLIVGGAPDESEGNAPVYRGDSFICGAAIQAGVLTNAGGGCGVLNLVGEKNSYGAETQNGMASVGFNSSFPMSFDFDRSEPVASASAKCQDPRWNLLTLSTIFTVAFSLFTTHPATFFGPIFTITFWQIAMASDPPSYSDYPSLASTALANFLPAAFIAAIIYQISVRKTLQNLNAQWEKTILWVGGLWVGALDNLTLDKIPLSRLTGHDINQQPGAITALVIIILVLIVIVLYQAWCFRLEGRLPKYLGVYATLAFCLLILLAVPSLDLRIHHYILALLLLPGTALQTRLSLVCQGLLVGLFINGVARWGFASLLQTAAALRGDAQLGTGIPTLLSPVINATNITFSWGPLAQGYEGVSVLVNDVERFRGFHKDGDNNFTWTRKAMDRPEFFRFGFVSFSPFGGITYSDFTRAGTWWMNGTWVEPPPGRT